MLNRLLVVMLIGLALASGPACATNPAPKDVQVVEGADSIVAVLTTFSHAVQAAADQGAITVPQAKKVLRIVNAAALTLRDTPEGGYQVASQAFDQIEAAVSPTARTKIAPYLETARAALEVFRAN